MITQHYRKSSHTPLKDSKGRIRLGFFKTSLVLAAGILLLCGHNESSVCLNYGYSLPVNELCHCLENGAFYVMCVLPQ